MWITSWSWIEVRIVLIMSASSFVVFNTLKVPRFFYNQDYIDYLMNCNTVNIRHYNLSLSHINARFPFKSLPRKSTETSNQHVAICMHIPNTYSRRYLWSNFCVTQTSLFIVHNDKACFRNQWISLWKLFSNCLYILSF